MDGIDVVDQARVGQAEPRLRTLRMPSCSLVLCSTNIAFGDPPRARRASKRPRSSPVHDRDIATFPTASRRWSASAGSCCRGPTSTCNLARALPRNRDPPPSTTRFPLSTPDGIEDFDALTAAGAAPGGQTNPVIVKSSIGVCGESALHRRPRKRGRIVEQGNRSRSPRPGGFGAHASSSAASRGSRRGYQ